MLSLSANSFEKGLDDHITKWDPLRISIN